MTIKLANNVSGFLNTAITASDTGIVLQSGNGASFPALGAGEYFYATLVSTGGTLEVVKVTARSGDSMTVVRAQDGTSAASFAAGSRLEIRINAQAVLDVVDQVTASQVGFTPVGGIAATDVQAAIAEVGTDLAASGGSALVGFLQAGANAEPRTVQSKLRDVVSVEDFGAVGDNLADDTQAIQDAANYCASFNSVVAKRPKLLFSPGKTYRTTDQITFTRTTHIDGQGATIRSEVNNASKSALYLGDPNTSTYMWHVHDLTVSFTPGTSASSGITVQRFLQGKIERVYISAFTKQLVLDSSGPDPFVGWLTVDKCYFQGGDYGVYGVSAPVNECIFTDSRYIQHAQWAIILDPATSVTVSKNDFSFCRGAVRVINGGSLRVQENYTESCGPGTENNIDSLASFAYCTNISFTKNSWNGVYGGWRDRKHLYFGVSMTGCRDANVSENYFTYFREAAVYFDATTGLGCVETNNSYSDNFVPYSYNKVIDLSGLVAIDGILLPVVQNTAPYVENYCPAPREIANQWTAGLGALVQRNFTNSTPYFDNVKVCDRITYNNTGNDKGISRATANVTGAAGRKFKLRFWGLLTSVASTAPLSGLASIQVRIFDGATLLKSQHIVLSKLWRLYEVEVTDTNATPHPITISIRPSDTIYMEFVWSMIGVQYCRAEAPYIYDRYTAVASYSNASATSSATPDTFPKIVKRDQFTNIHELDAAAPTSGTWAQGDIVWNRTPTAGGNIGWVCTTAGTPGTWKTFGTIAP